MNTIGKPGKLGEHISCVVSVAMLTEGWDANTVTHILGVRPFRSQLLCEQVFGRGLRRATARYQWCAAVNNNGRWGRWGYVEVHNPADEAHIYGAIDALAHDQLVIGLPA